MVGTGNWKLLSIFNSITIINVVGLAEKEEDIWIDVVK